MIHTTKNIQKNNTTYFECRFRNLDGEFVDPSTNPTYEIRSESGSIVQSGSLQKRKDGYWGTYYTPTDIGLYEISYSGEINSKVVLIKDKFRVITIKKTKW